MVVKIIMFYSILYYCICDIVTITAIIVSIHTNVMMIIIITPNIINEHLIVLLYSILSTKDKKKVTVNTIIYYNTNNDLKY